MRRRSIQLMAAVVAALSAAAAQAAFVPISITGHNQDMVVESGAANPPSGGATSASMDAGTGNTGASWYEQGYNGGAAATGLPVAGASVASFSGSDHAFTMPGSYTAANAFMLDSGNTSATITLSNPLAYSSLSLLTSSGHGAGTIGYTINYADGSTGVGSIVSPDWFNNDPRAVVAAGRVDVQTGGFDNVNADNPRLYQIDIAADAGKAVNSVDLSWISGTAGNTVTAVMGLSGEAALEVFTPGDSHRPYNSAGAPNENEPNEGVDEAIDNNYATKFLSSNLADPGLEVYPVKGLSVAKALVLTAGNDAPDRDPTSYVLQGSNDGGSSWTTISSGAVGEFANRFATQTIDIANDDVYGNYRVYFPTNDGSNLMQIGEVEILASEIRTDVTLPTNTITAYNASGAPNSPANEQVQNAIDNDPNTKYLNFNTDNPGFTVELDMMAIVTGVGLRTANDSPERNPGSFTLQGSYDGINFTDIVADFPVDPIDDFFFLRNFAFDNETPYAIYRLFFPTLQGGGGIFQIGEVQLYGVKWVPAPAALPAGLLLMGALGMRRRRTGVN